MIAAYFGNASGEFFVKSGMHAARHCPRSLWRSRARGAPTRRASGSVCFIVRERYRHRHVAGRGRPRFRSVYTTKPMGEGTGLGLSVIYGFVRQSGGQVRIYSEVGKGTMVCLYLPRHHESAAADEEPEMEAPAKPCWSWTTNPPSGAGGRSASRAGLCANRSGRGRIGPQGHSVRPLH